MILPVAMALASRKEVYAVSRVNNSSLDTTNGAHSFTNQCYMDVTTGGHGSTVPLFSLKIACFTFHLSLSPILVTRPPSL